MKIKNPVVYIMTNIRRNVIYIGVTSNLSGRVWQHKNGATAGFAQKHKTRILVYYETHNSISEAILRERQIKKWNRKWKEKLIEKMNPYWSDLGGDIL